MEQRWGIWCTHLLLGIIVLVSVIDYIPASQRGQKENYTISCASVSLSLSFIMTMSHFFAWTKQRFVGTIMEMFFCTVPLAMWVVGTIIIQNPENWFASIVDSNTGFEEIQYANLYFGSWAILFHNLYLLAMIFHDTKGYDRDLPMLVMMFSNSATLCGITSTLRKDICNLDGPMACRRCDLGIAVGAIMAYLSLLSLLLIGCGKLSTALRLLVGFISTGLYVTGVLFLTSAGGIAVDLGTIYFTLWGGTVISVVLFTRAIGEAFDSSIVDRDGRAKPAATSFAANELTAMEHDI